MNDLAWLLGSLSGRLADPFTWIAIAIAFGIGCWRPLWWAPAAIAVLAQIVLAVRLYAWWQSLGINVPAHFIAGMLLLGILTYAAYGLARLVLRMKPVA